MLQTGGAQSLEAPSVRRRRRLALSVADPPPAAPPLFWWIYRGRGFDWFVILLVSSPSLLRTFSLVDSLVLEVGVVLVDLLFAVTTSD